MKLREYERIGERVYTHRLDNGLTIFFIKKKEYYKSYAFFATNYGGADRRFKLNGQWIDTPAGVAHYLEHKMFDMPEGNALTILSQNGASPNAFTATDMTAYHFECTDHFYDNLAYLLKFVTTPYFLQESVDKERGIIGQEIRMGEDNPHRAVYYGLMQSLYKSHPLREEVAGSVESIQDITPQVLNDCHRVFYNPNNMVLCVAGDEDEEKILRVAQETLTQRKGPEPERDYGQRESVRPEKRRAERKMEVGVPLFMMGAKDGPALTGEELQKRQYTAELAMQLICGRSSALYEKLYNDGLINRSFTFGYETTAGQSYLLMGGDSRQPEKVYDEIMSAAERVRDGGADETAFNRQKKALIGRELRQLDDFEDICYNTAVGYFHGYDSFRGVDALRTVTPEDVRDFAAKALREDHFALSTVR